MDRYYLSIFEHIIGALGLTEKKKAPFIELNEQMGETEREPLLQPTRPSTSSQSLPVSTSVPDDDVFGNDQSALAIWFKPERFLQQDFNAEAFVAEVRRYVRPSVFSLSLRG
jgi:hypothetical protein